MEYYHNTTDNISKSNLSQISNILPSRDEFLDEKDVKTMRLLMKNKKELLFLGNDIKESLPFHNYKIILSGILPCGTKTVLEIANIYPYFDVEYDNTKTEEENRNDIKHILINDKLFTHETKIVYGKNLILFSETNKKYVRLYFRNISTRKKSIQLLRKLNYKTYNNDLSCYYRVVAREYKLNLCSWNTIINYDNIKKDNKYKSKYQLSVNINNINSIDILTNKDELMETYDIKYSNLQKDKLVSMCFDIEMYSSEFGRIPSGKNKDDIIFMICMTFQFINDDKSFYNVCLCTRDCENQPEMHTIVCKDEKTLLQAFASVVNCLQPDFITEFNGSDFDWKVIIEKCEYYNLLPYYASNFALDYLSKYNLDVDQILKWNAKKDKIKLDAEQNAYSYNFQQFGYIAFDTRIIFRRLYSKESKSSLNFYLQLNNLELKDDMDIKRMFEIYESGTAEEMKLVAHYCFVDSFRLHELLIKKNIIQDKREVCLLSYTSMFDGFYRADGVKVRNMVYSYCLEKNLYFDTIMDKIDDEEESAKYPGAMVLNPIKGLVSSLYNVNEYNKKYECNESQEEIKEVYNYITKNYDSIFLKKNKQVEDNKSQFCNNYINYIKSNEIQYPVSGLDFSSLYPSIIMAYNLSPEYLVLDDDEAYKLKDKGYNLHRIKFDLLNKDKNTITGWTVRHDNKDESFGLYPFILKELFDKRALMKKKLFIYKEKKEHMELEDPEEKKYLTNDEYNDCMFNLNYFNAKQLALKVFMNTFYGETGNNKSPLFMLQLAGGVTSAGQYNLMMIKDYVDKAGTKIYYGDTDSLYISCNPKSYIDNDRLYYTNQISKEDYSKNMVDITFIEIDKLKQLVNKKLMDDNGTKFLKMSYEEVLFPAAFLSKKKYFGIPHEGVVNFKPKDLFIRGLEVKKRGSSQLLVKNCMDILWKSMLLKNTDTIKELVIENIEHIFNTKWNVEDFIKTSKWDPTKQNVKNNTFIQRLKDRNIPLPEQYQRFNYIIVKKYPYTYDLKGRQTKLSVGDKMELIETVKEHNLEIDLLYYFENEISGQMARLISYDPEYEIIKDNIVDDVATYNNCKKVIKVFADKYNNSYKNIGKIYKDLYRTVSKQIKPSDNNKLKHILTLNNNINEYNDMIINLEKYAESKINSIYIKNLINRYKKNMKEEYIYKLHILYSKKKTSYYNKKLLYLKEKISDNKIKLYNLLQKYNLLEKILNYNEINISNIIKYVKNIYDFNSKCGNYDSKNELLTDVIKEEEIMNIVNDDNLYIKIEKDKIDEIYNLINLILTNYKMYYINEKLQHEIYILINKSNNIIEKPLNFKY